MNRRTHDFAATVAMIYTGRYRFKLESGPWNKWVTIPARALGKGKCRVDVCANDQVLGRRDIEIVESGN